MSSQENPFQAAIDLTFRAIQKRGRMYRNLVVAVSILLVGSIFSGVLRRSWRPLWGFTLVIPATAVFLAVDARVVRKWSDEIRRLSKERRMSLQSFSSAMLAQPLIPAATIKGMLAQLNRPDETA